MTPSTDRWTILALNIAGSIAVILISYWFLLGRGVYWRHSFPLLIFAIPVLLIVIIAYMLVWNYRFLTTPHRRIFK